MRKWTSILVLYVLATGGTAYASLTLNPYPYGPFLFTWNIGPNGVVGFPKGWFLCIGTFINDPDDPVGIPENITSVTASQEGGANFFELTYFYHPPYFLYWGVENILQPYSQSGPTGQWTITGTNKQGEVVSIRTTSLDRPAVVPTTTVRFEKIDDKWHVLWDFAPFRTYAYGVDQIEIRILRSMDDQLQRVLLSVNPSIPEPDRWEIPDYLQDEPLWFHIIARDLDKFEAGYPLENRSSSFGYFNPNPAPDFAFLECEGFEPPLDKNSVEAIPPDTLPFKAQLFHADGSPVIDGDLLAPPVIRVRYIPAQPGKAEDVTDRALPIGLGTDRNGFAFTPNGRWRFNLSTENYTEPGTYMVGILSGDRAEYVIHPSCMATFVIK